MRPVHVVGVGAVPARLADHHFDEAELVHAVTSAALADAGLSRRDVGFICSGSSDYVVGRPFSFVMALDGAGAWPPARESHVEMDGAFALYEAWVRLQHGDVDTAVVYAYGKSSTCRVDDVLSQQLDPYTLFPLGVSVGALAALQAQALIDAGHADERAFAEVLRAARRAAAANPDVPAPSDDTVEALLAAPRVVGPLRAHDRAVGTDGAAAVVLKVAGTGPRIDGFAHRIEPHALGVRDLTDIPSLRRTASDLRASHVDVAELHTPYTSQAALLRRMIGLGDAVSVDAAGGTLVADTPMVAGLTRVIEVVRALRGGARRGVAHTTVGPCLQHNLLCVLEAA